MELIDFARVCASIAPFAYTLRAHIAHSRANFNSFSSLLERLLRFYLFCANVEYVNQFITHSVAPHKFQQLRYTHSSIQSVCVSIMESAQVLMSECVSVFVCIK